MAAFEAHSSILTRAELDEDQLRRAVSLFKKALFYGEKCLRTHPGDKAMGFVPMLRQIYDELEDVDRYEMALAYRLHGEVALQEAIQAMNAEGGLGAELRDVMGGIWKEVLEENAIPAFQEAIRRKPDYAGARWRMAEAYRMLGQYRQAVSMLQEGIQLSPGYWQTYFVLGDFYKDNLNDPRAAIQVYRKGLEINPSWAAGHRILGICYAVTDQYSAAIPCFRKAIELDPSDGQAYTGLALACVQTGRAQEGVVYLQRAAAMGDSQAKALLRQLQQGR